MSVVRYLPLYRAVMGFPEAGHPLSVAFNLVAVVAGVAMALGLLLGRRVYSLAQGVSRQ